MKMSSHREDIFSDSMGRGLLRLMVSSCCCPPAALRMRMSRSFLSRMSRSFVFRLYSGALVFDVLVQLMGEDGQVNMKITGTAVKMGGRRLKSWKSSTNNRSAEQLITEQSSSSSASTASRNSRSSTSSVVSKGIKLKCENYKNIESKKKFRVWLNLYDLPSRTTKTFQNLPGVRTLGPWPFRHASLIVEDMEVLEDLLSDKSENGPLQHQRQHKIGHQKTDRRVPYIRAYEFTDGVGVQEFYPADRQNSRFPEGSSEMRSYKWDSKSVRSNLDHLVDERSDADDQIQKLMQTRIRTELVVPPPSSESDVVDDDETTSSSKINKDEQGLDNCSFPQSSVFSSLSLRDLSLQAEREPELQTEDNIRVEGDPLGEAPGDALSPRSSTCTLMPWYNDPDEEDESEPGPINHIMQPSDIIKPSDVCWTPNGRGIKPRQESPILLGETNLDIHRIAHDLVLGGGWDTEDYRTFHHNCWHFVYAVTRRIGIDDGRSMKNTMANKRTEEAEPRNKDSTDKNLKNLKRDPADLSRDEVEVPEKRRSTSTSSKQEAISARRIYQNVPWHVTKVWNIDYWWSAASWRRYYTKYSLPSIY